eukprot:1466938-Ditylum_brightwellii.AAC.1
MVGCCVSVGELIAVQQLLRFRQQTGQFLKADVLIFLVIEGGEVNQSTGASKGPQAFTKQQTGQFLKADVPFFHVLEGGEVNQSTGASAGPQAFNKYYLKCWICLQLLQLCAVTVAYSP